MTMYYLHILMIQTRYGVKAQVLPRSDLRRIRTDGLVIMQELDLEFWKGFREHLGGRRATHHQACSRGQLLHCSVASCCWALQMQLERSSKMETKDLPPSNDWRDKRMVWTL